MARSIPNVHVLDGFAPADAGMRSKQALFQAGAWFAEPTDGVPTTQRATDRGDGTRPIIRVTNKIDIFAVAAPSPDIVTGVLQLLRAADAPHDLYCAPGSAFVWTAAT